MKTKANYKKIVRISILIFLVGSACFWFKITNYHTTQVIDNQPVIPKSDALEAAVSILKTLPATAH
jgi:hypothetical protein